jgi:hypothetical protein
MRGARDDPMGGLMYRRSRGPDFLGASEFRHLDLHVHAAMRAGQRHRVFAISN